MPTIFEVHHVYNEPITNCINPNLNQTRCVTGPNIFNGNITDPNVFIQVEREPNAILPREMCT